MKIKAWDITVKDNPNRIVMIEDDEFYTTDTEAFLVFNLKDEDFYPQSAMITLENRNDGSLKSEEVEVTNGVIQWEMPERYIEHSGNWQAQLVYEQMKGEVPEKYTSGVMAFTVNSYIKDKKKPRLVEIENWEKFIREGTELIETWEDMETLREENERQRQEHENQRDSNENTRQEQEVTRENQESIRESQEVTRENQESIRENQEGERVEAERERTDTFESWDKTMSGILPNATETVAGVVKIERTEGELPVSVPSGKLLEETTKAINDRIDTKVDTLTPGENITIDDDNVISAIDTIYDDTEIRGLIDNKVDKQDLISHLADTAQRFGNIEQQLEDGTAGIDDSVISDSKVWSSSKTQQEIENLINIPSTVYTSDTQPPNPNEGDIWFKIISSAPDIPVTDYLFRFDANELDLDDGANVLEWEDLSGNSYNLTPSIGNSLFIADGLNGKPTVRLQNTELKRTPFALTKLSEATLIVVCEFDSTTGGSASVLTIGPNTPIALRYSSSGVMAMRFPGYQRANTSLITAPTVYIGTFDKETTTRIYKNGTEGNPSVHSLDIATHNEITVGSSKFDGRISEVIYFERCLSEQEITELNSYLMQKWGI